MLPVTETMALFAEKGNWTSVENELQVVCRSPLGNKMFGFAKDKILHDKKAKAMDDFSSVCSMHR